jgi:tetratricopeptide (TPR) repeat protein
MRAPTLVFMLFLGTLSLAQVKGGLAADQVYSRNKPSVVTVLTFDSQNAALGQGSGFIVAKDRVLTNFHVTEGSSSALIVFSDGAIEKTDSVAAGSFPKDVVVLKVQTGKRPPVAFGNELNLRIGDTIYAIGAPKGLSASLSSGLVSAFRQDKGQFLIQITASIAPGSSGGPVLNAQGQVVGVATSRLTEGNFGFAIGAADIQQLLKAPLSMDTRLSDLKTDKSEPPVGEELAASRALYDAKKYSDALASFQTLSAPIKNSFKGQFLLCQIETELTSYDLALRACNSAITVQPDDASAYGQKAFILFVSGDIEKAEIAASTATRLSDEKYYKNLLGVIYYSGEKFDLVRQQLGTDSDDPFVLSMLAGAALRTSNSVDFRRLLAKLTALKGSSNGWQLYLDAIKAQENLELDTAIDRLRRCDADKDFIDAVCIAGVAQIEAVQGKYDIAVKEIAAAVQRYPRNSAVLSTAIFINLLVGRSSEATRLYNTLEGTSSGKSDDSTSCLYYYGIDQPSLARAHCKASVTANPKNYTAWSNSGYVALDNGEYQDAVTQFATAANLFYAENKKHMVMQEVDIAWGAVLSSFYAGNKKGAKNLFGEIKKEYPQFVSLDALKGLPLVWSQRTQQLVTGVIKDFK